MKENGGNLQSDVQFSSVTGEGLAENANRKMHQNLLALSRVSAAVSGLWDLDVILEIALDNVLSIMDGAIGGILLLDAETQTLSYRVYRGLSAEVAEVTRLKLGEGIAGAVAQSGRSVLLEDVSLDPRVVYPELVRKEGLKALIGVPLRSKEVVLGVIIVASLMAHKFTKDDMHLLLGHPLRVPTSSQPEGLELTLNNRRLCIQPWLRTCVDTNTIESLRESQVEGYQQWPSEGQLKTSVPIRLPNPAVVVGMALPYDHWGRASSVSSAQILKNKKPGKYNLLRITSPRIFFLLKRLGA
jgi:putative methionine-R-sulfoxide reductase with GAF domain